MFLKILYAGYWVVVGYIIWKSEKKISWLEEENRHLKELIDIREGERKRAKNSCKIAKNTPSKV